MTDISLRHLCDIAVDLADPIELGTTARGRRRMIPIIGGRVTGQRLSGTILNLGADWQTIFGDGSAELDTRYAMETDDGAFIDIRNFGYRHGPREVIERLGRGEEVDPAQYYMRTQPRLESGDEKYSWLNRTIFLGTGSRRSNSVNVSFFEVL